MNARFWPHWIRFISPSSLHLILEFILLQFKMQTFEAGHLRTEIYDSTAVFDHYSQRVGSSEHILAVHFDFHPDQYDPGFVFDGVVQLLKQAYSNANNSDLDFDHRHSVYGIPYLTKDFKRVAFDENGKPCPTSELGLWLTVGGGTHSGEYFSHGGIRTWVPSKTAGIQLSKLTLVMRMTTVFTTLNPQKPTEVFVIPKAWWHLLTCWMGKWCCSLPNRHSAAE